MSDQDLIQGSELPDQQHVGVQEIMRPILIGDILQQKWSYSEYKANVEDWNENFHRVIKPIQGYLPVFRYQFLVELKPFHKPVNSLLA